MGPPLVALYSDPDPGAIKQKDLFLSYQQGIDQAITHYLNVKWSLFEQGWPNPARRSIAFGIEDNVNGIHNRTIRKSLDKECVATFSALFSRVVQRIKTERTHMSYGKSFNKSWQGLELQGDAWVTPPITTLRDQRTRPRRGGAWHAGTFGHNGWPTRERCPPATPQSFGRSRGAPVGGGHVTSPQQHDYQGKDGAFQQCSVSVSR